MVGQLFLVQSAQASVGSIPTTPGEEKKRKNVNKKKKKKKKRISNKTIPSNLEGEKPTWKRLGRKKSRRRLSIGMDQARRR